MGPQRGQPHFVLGGGKDVSTGSRLRAKRGAPSAPSSPPASHSAPRTPHAARRTPHSALRAPHAALIIRAMRTHRSLFTLIVCLFSAALASPLAQQAPQGGRQGGANAGGPLPTIEQRTSGMQKLDGYVPLYWDEKTGSLWMEIKNFDTEML